MIEDMWLWKKYVERFVTPRGEPRPAMPAPVFAVAPPPDHLDLHGLTVHDAYRATVMFIARSVAARHKTVTIVTGRSGVIRKEFPAWVERSSDVKRCELLFGEGAFRLHLRLKN